MWIAFGPCKIFQLAGAVEMQGNEHHSNRVLLAEHIFHRAGRLLTHGIDNNFFTAQKLLSNQLTTVGCLGAPRNPLSQASNPYHSVEMSKGTRSSEL